VSELFEPSHQGTLQVFLAELVEVLIAEIPVILLVSEHVPSRLQQAIGYGYQGSLLAAMPG
jgi:hypothetical protein